MDEGEVLWEGCESGVGGGSARERGREWKGKDGYDGKVVMVWVAEDGIDRWEMGTFLKPCCPFSLLLYVLIASPTSISLLIRTDRFCDFRRSGELPPCAP